MAGDMHARKMAARFDAFDRDGDGLLSQRDVEQMARDLLEEFGISPDWGKGRALLRGAGAYWRGMADEAEVDPAGRLTRQQWIAASKHALLDHPEGFARIIRPWVEASIAIVDGDGDGEIGVEEWGRMLRAMGGEDASASSRHGADGTGDGTGDGSLRVSDLLATARDFYTTDLAMPDI